MTTDTGFIDRARIENSRWYGQALVSLLATGPQTNNTFALLEAMVHSGEEVPFHTHSQEDESFYMLEGEITFYVGEQMMDAKTGDFIFLPRNVRHSWRSTTNARCLVLITPAGFERSFVEFSEPVISMSLPPRQEGPPPEEYLQALLSRENELGVFYDFQQASSE
jgi:quercetin dioxygenase-like cupin family protein